MARTLPSGGFILAVLLATMGCGTEPPSSAGSVTHFSVPASIGSGQPHLYAEAGGPVWLNWVGPTSDDQHAVNDVFRAQDPGDPLAEAMERRAEEALDAVPEELATLPRWKAGRPVRSPASRFYFPPHSVHPVLPRQNRPFS